MSKNQVPPIPSKVRDCDIGLNKQTNKQTICYLQETNFKFKDKNRLKVKGWKRTGNANNHKRAGGAILTQTTRTFKQKPSLEVKRTFHNDKRTQ